MGNPEEEGSETLSQEVCEIGTKMWRAGGLKDMLDKQINVMET